MARCLPASCLCAGLSWREPGSVMRVNLPKVARRSCAAISPVYIYYTRELSGPLSCAPCSMLLAARRLASDRFSAATTATGKLQVGPKHATPSARISKRCCPCAACVLYGHDSALCTVEARFCKTRSSLLEGFDGAA